VGHVHRVSQNFGNAKVANLDLVVPAQEDIHRLDVSV
jgi:hypothetical protein